MKQPPVHYKQNKSKEKLSERAQTDKRNLGK